MIGFAHRGGMADAPENSMEAFTKALARGVNGIESDVWLDASGVAVLHHGRPGPQDRGPALAELLTTCGTDFDLSLDMKGPGTASATIDVARSSGFALERLWLCGTTASEWRGLDPDVRLVTDMRWRDALWDAAPAMARVAAGGVNAVNLRHGRWTRGLVAKAHAEGLLAFGWDVQTRWTMRHAVWIGLDAVYSDHPRLLVDHLPR